MNQPKSIVFEEYYSINPAVSVRELPEIGAVLFNSDTRAEKVVNKTGLLLFKQLNGLIPLKDNLDKFISNFDTVDRVEIGNDLKDFLGELIDEDFVKTGKSDICAEAEYRNDEDSPRDFDISITRHCNLKCAYCFYDHEMKYRHDLPFEEWDLFFHELKSLGVRNITLSGGEPFIRKDIWKILDSLVDSRLRIAILSNGTLIDESAILKLQKVRHHLDYIQLSVDGSCPEVHDLSRGAGTFHRVISALRLLKSAKIPVCVRATINRHNVDDLENLTHFLLDEIGLASFSTNDAVSIGAGCDNLGDIHLTIPQKLVAMKKLAHLREKYDGRISATAGSLANWHFFQKMEAHKISGRSNPGSGFLSSCGCALGKLAVHHDGVIDPCNMLPGFELGRINQDSISDIWKSHPTMIELRNRRKIPLKSLESCKTCTWQDHCRGGCPGPVYQQTGKLNVINPDDCYKLFLEQTGGVKPWTDANE